MNKNINITNINKHFFPHLDIIDDCVKPHKTKLTNYSFYSINEANISDKIKQIPYYINNYLIVEDYDFVNISQLNEKIIEKLNIENDKRYLIFKYKNDSLVNFNDFLFNLNDPTIFIQQVILSFDYLLKSLIKLNNIGICYFDLHPQNIVFNIDCGEKPAIQNFTLSLNISNLNETYITNIIKKINNYTHKPLEVHILFYLIQNNISTISYSFIEEICEVFKNNLCILTLFSEKTKENYKISCIETLKKYINKPKTIIIQDILNNANKWDVYSLSMLYLHIFWNISKVFSLKQNFISKIIIELYKNIDPEPSKRNNLEQLSENLDKLFNEENNWCFVKKIPRSI